jgi:asparagine synthase (glutamine-hydrolysing)
MSQRLRPLLSRELVHRFAHRDPYRVLLNELDVSGRLEGREAVHQALYLWARTDLPNYVLTVLGDRMEMAHSIEGRVPFLDHEVVELAMRFPGSLLINGTTEKYVLREAARDVLTETVYRRQKHPFLAPPATSGLSGPLFERLQDTLRSRALASLPIFDQAAVLSLLDRLRYMDPETRQLIDPVLMLVTSACVLHERFGLQ